MTLNSNNKMFFIKNKKSLWKKEIYITFMMKAVHQGNGIINFLKKLINLKCRVLHQYLMLRIFLFRKIKSSCL